MARPAGPTLDRLAILDEQGHRKKVHPADVDGRFQRLKPFVRWALIGFFLLLPLIEIGGHPAVLFDVPARRFYLLGKVFGTGDLPFLFFLMTAGGFGLVVITALFGRVWCGWGCPQTVYMEGIFRRIERKLEGNGAARMALDLGPWNSKKIRIKLLKWSLWMVASFVTAHIFISYFVSLPRMWDMMWHSPTEHPVAFAFAAFATGITYFNFAWFREQTCLIICPYGRLQSAMQDRDSIVIGYDKKRGEPRGKKTDTNAGDCVDCRRCIDVCPTGIDIRNGLQMECIGCAACVDACDDIMGKLGRAKGLVRYDSERALAGESRRFWRPRLLGYAVIGLIGATVFSTFALTRHPLVARIVRPARAPWAEVTDADGRKLVQNSVMVHIENRSSERRRVAIAAIAAHPVTVTLPLKSLVLEPQDRTDIPVLVRVPESDYKTGLSVPIEVQDADSGGQELTQVQLDVLGPVRIKASASP